MNLGLSSEQRRNIEEACRAVEIRPMTCVTINRTSGQPILQITDFGDLIMHGGALHEQANIQVPVDPTLTVKADGWDPLALVNLVTGDLYLKGNAYYFWGGDIASYVQPESLIITKADGEPVASINSQGFWIWAYFTYVPPGSLVISGKIILVDE